MGEEEREGGKVEDSVLNGKTLTISEMSRLSRSALGNLISATQLMTDEVIS